MVLYLIIKHKKMDYVYLTLFFQILAKLTVKTFQQIRKLFTFDNFIFFSF